MNALQKFIISKEYGFLKTEDMPALIELDRFCPVLLRFECCRLTTTAQYVAHIIAAMRAGGETLRDVSIAFGALERAANWSPERKEPASVRPAVPMARRDPAPRPVYRNFNENDCGGTWDGFNVTSDADPGL